MSIIITGLILSSIYSVYVVCRLVGRDEYSVAQKVSQIILILVLPFIGAIIVHGLIRETDSSPEQIKSIDRTPFNGPDGWTDGGDGD